MYELLKNYFQYKNESFEVVSTALIGALTTFAHDFFITPSDSKINDVFNIFSDQATTLIVL